MSNRANSRVALAACSGYGVEMVEAAVRHAVELLGGAEQYVKPGDNILVKPNLLLPKDSDKAATTHPSVFRAVLRLMQDAGAVVSYGDSPAVGTTRGVARKAGLLDVVEELQIPEADMVTRVEMPFPQGNLIKQFTLAKGVVDADGLISVCKMKTHALTRMTGAVKNQFGCIPGMLKSEFHGRLTNDDLFSRMLVDLNLLMRPRLFIMDAVVAMEGNGPASGTPRQVGLILASDDPVALDATVCYLIGLNPELVPTIRWGEKLGLGDYRTMKWLGESPDDWIQQGFRVNRSVGPTSLSGTSALAPIARNFLIPKPVIDEEKCTRCGQCVDICPVHPKALQFPVTPKGHVPRYDYSACIRCYCCHETCPSAAIRIRVPLAGRILH
jgi:uncharacterized protein (DUF362 family)/NAD-dependent dihydropyrimidine dehydrogenase PreA subunit